MDCIKQLMDKTCLPSDAFMYDEAKAVSAKQFFSLYKDQFPIMAIFTEGYYGNTQFDCYDSYQVFRIHGYTSQPRVVAVESSEATLQRHQYLSIPVDTPIKFRVVKGHETVGEVQTLSTILKENQLPVLIQPACDRQCRVRVWMGDSGSEWRKARDFGNLLITKRFEERFMMIQCLYSQDLNISEYVNLLALTPELTMTAITGFAHETGTEDEFKAYLQKLEEITKQEMEKTQNKNNYDTARGNPDWGRCFLETVSLATGSGGETSDYAPLVRFEEVFPDTGPPPALPPRKDQISTKTLCQITNQGPSDSPGRVEDTEAVYEELDADYSLDNTEETAMLKPELPSRERKKNKSDSKKHNKHKEKDFKHLEKSIKHKKAQEMLISPSDKIAVEIPKNPQVKKTRMINTETTIRTTYSDGTPDIVNDSTKESRYVSLLSTRKESGYSKVMHGVDENSKGQYSHAYAAANFQGLQDVATNLKEIYTERDISKMTISQLGESLKSLRLDKHIKAFKDQLIDGAIVQELTVDDFMREFHFTRLEALRLAKFVSSGHIPK